MTANVVFAADDMPCLEEENGLGWVLPDFVAAQKVSLPSNLA